MKIFFEGDLQIYKAEYEYNKDSLRLNAQKEYLDWVLNNPKLNNEETIYFSLGDFFENSIPTPEETELALYYLSTGKWKYKVLIAGNHDYNRIKNTFSIQPFNKLKNTELILKPMEKNIEGLNCLVLPYYYDNIFPDLPPMKEYYEGLSGTYDLIISHIQDETQSFGDNKSVDITKLKGQRIQGHLHAIKNNTSGYVNSPLACTKGEVLEKRYCFLYDIDTKTIEKIEIPIFLNYKEIIYPDIIEDKKEIKNTWYTIKDSVDKETTLNFYKNKYPNIYIKEVIKKRLQTISEEYKSQNKKSTIDFFEEFVLENKISKGVETIIKEKLFI